MSSLNDTPALTPKLEAAVRGGINPAYVNTYGTASHERAALLGEIDRLRAEVAELAQQRGDLARRVLELEADARRIDWLADPANTIGNVELPTKVVRAHLHSLRDAIDAAMAMDPRTANVASDSQPSEQTK